MTTIKELATIFQGVIKEYVDCADFDEKAEPQSELLKDLINSLLNTKELTDTQINYSCSPMLYHGIKWNTAAFSRACELGHLEFAKWLKNVIAYKLFTSQNTDMRDINLNDYIELIKKLKEQWSIVNVKPRILEWFIEKGSGIDTEHAFRSACNYGHLEIAIWLKSQWPEINHRVNNDEPFRHACANGHINVAKWLKQNWPDIDHTAGNNEAFLKTCTYGYVNIAKWLKEEFKCDTICSDRDIGQAFVETCEFGNLDMAKWLNENFAANQIMHPISFERACTHGHLDIAKWLKEIVMLTIDSANECFERACVNGHIETAKWIKSQWPTVKCKPRMLRDVCIRYHIDMAVWLRDIYPNIKIN